MTPNTTIRLINYDGLMIAINLDHFTQNHTATVYLDVHPVDQPECKLIAKLIPHDKPPDPKPQGVPHKWQRAVPTQYNQWFQGHIEAHNGNLLFSSRCLPLNGGIMILMSKIPGVCLLDLLDTLVFRRLTPLQRIELAINIVNNYQTLHDNGVVHGDAGAKNIIIDLDTLQGMPIDINAYYGTELTQAPEKKASIQADLYAIAQDILMPIFCGVRPLKTKEGKMINEDRVYLGLYINFIHPSCDGISHLVIESLQNLLERMHSCAPDQRGSLQETKQSLEELKDIIYCAPFILEIDPIKKEMYQQQLRILDHLLLKK